VHERLAKLVVRKGPEARYPKVFIAGITATRSVRSGAAFSRAAYGISPENLTSGQRVGYPLERGRKRHPLSKTRAVIVRSRRGKKD
jgi:hypothetical protein